MKILLLEDNNKLNETITKRLKIKNYNVISFTDGSDAYENLVWRIVSPAGKKRIEER